MSWTPPVPQPKVGRSGGGRTGGAGAACDKLVHERTSIPRGAQLVRGATIASASGDAACPAHRRRAAGRGVDRFKAEIPIRPHAALAIVEAIAVDFRGLNRHGIFRRRRLLGRRARGEPVSGPDRAALAERVDALMTKLLVPGVAVGLLDPDGERTWSFGVTNVEHPLPVDADTIFEIASVTKTMTATVAARLAAEGRLDLDAPVRRYLPDFRVADRDVSDRVTVRDLFSHTAGWFGEYLEPSGYGEDAISRAVAGMATVEQVSPVGVYSYNNSSLTVAGRVIEVATGSPYAQAVRELLFVPLGMTRSAFDAADLLYERLAAGHTVREGAPAVVRTRFCESRNGDPAGGARSTVHDLLRYARFHLGDGTAADGTRLLPAAALAAMREPRVSMGPIGHVGLAWFISDRGGTRVIAHGGATVAHMSQLVLVPERGVACVILTNGAQGAALYAELQEWLFTGWLGLPASPVPPPLAPQPDPAPYVGRYWAPLSDVELVPDAGGLVLRLRWKASVAERPVPRPVRLAFTGRDVVVSTGPSAAPPMGDFLRHPDGSVAYFRWGGRARRKVG